MAPEVCVTDGVTTYCCDKQVMLGIGVQISISKATPIAAAGSSKCKICSKLVKRDLMRLHIGTRISCADITEECCGVGVTVIIAWKR